MAAQILAQNGIHNVSVLNGKTALGQREKTLKKFRQDASYRVLLMSDVGVTGLNITQASVVIIAVSESAIYRSAN
jgi:superfamily II DNA/RNA helicase